MSDIQAGDTVQWVETLFSNGRRRERHMQGTVIERNGTVVTVQPQGKRAKAILIHVSQLTTIAQADSDDDTALLIGWAGATL